MAQEIYQSFDFSGGLRLTDRHSEPYPNECTLAQNFISNGKALQVLPGYTAFNSVPVTGYTTAAVKSLFRFIKPSDPTVKRFLAHIGDAVCVADEVDKSWTPVITGLGSSSVTDFVTFGDVHCYLTASGNGIYKYHGSGSPYLVAGAPQGSTISAHYNRLFAGGVPEHPNRFYWSSPGQPDDWDMVEQYQELPSVDGDAITRIIFFHDGSIIFKQRSMWHISGNVEPFPVYSISESMGTPAAKSVVLHGDVVIWFAANGHIYAYDGARIVNLTETKLGPLPVARSMMDKVCASIIDDQLWVSYCDRDSGDTFNNRVLIADLRYGIGDPRWFGPHTGYHITSFCTFDGQGDSGATYFGDANTSRVWVQGDIYYHGLNISGSITSSTTTVISAVAGESIAQNALAGCVIDITAGTGSGQRRIIVANSAFTGSGSTYSGTITVHNPWDTAPDSSSVWETGRIDAAYRTGNLIMQSPERQKIFDKIIVHAESQGDYPLTIELLKDHARSGNQYAYSLLGSGSLWDESTWDASAYASLDMLARYIDLDFEYAKYLTVELSLSGANRPALIYGWMLLFYYGDMLHS